MMPNYFIVLVAAIVNMAIGFAWYSPMLFAKQWMKYNGFSGKDMKDMGKGMQKTYGMLFIASLITAFVLGWFIKATNATTLASAVKIGILAWLGFSTTVQFTSWVFSGKSKNAYFLDTGYQLVGFIGMAVVFGLWQ